MTSAENPKWATLQFSVKNGNYHVAKRLIKKFFIASLDELNYVSQAAGEETLLITAVTHNKPEMVKLLLRYGVKLNTQGKNGRTALMIAAELKNEEMLEALVGAGAKLDVEDDDGVTVNDIIDGNPVLRQAISKGMRKLKKKAVSQEKKSTKISESPATIIGRCGVRRETFIGLMTELTGFGFSKPDALRALSKVSEDLPAEKVESNDAKAKEKERAEKLVQRAIEYLFDQAESKKNGGRGKEKLDSKTKDSSPEVLEAELQRRQLALDIERQEDKLKAERELEDLMTLRYTWCVKAAIAGGSLSKGKLDRLKEIRSEKHLSEEQHQKVLESLGLTKEIWDDLKLTCIGIEQKVQKVNTSISAKFSEYSMTKGIDKNAIEKQILLEMHGSECTVCLDAPCNQIFLDCMHLCVCSGCAHLFRPKSGRLGQISGYDEEPELEFIDFGVNRARRGRGGMGRMSGFGRGFDRRSQLSDEEEPRSGDGEKDEKRCPQCQAVVREVRPVYK